MQPTGIHTSQIWAGTLRSLVTPLVAFSAMSSSASAAVVDFSDPTLAADSFYNGGPATNSAGWSSGGATFGNDFTDFGGGFNGWNGFAYSNVNDPTTAGFGNQYAAYTGTGLGGSGIYAVAYSGSAAFVDLPAGANVQSVYLTNTTYAALDMLHGSAFSKQFGGVSGDDADFLDVIITGYDGLGGMGSTTGAVVFRLADYTFADNSQDYIVDVWSFVDLTPLGSAASLRFTWASSDVGVFGINTPTYVALDNLSYTVIPEPAGVAGLAGLVMLGFTAGRRRGVRRCR